MAKIRKCTLSQGRSMGVLGLIVALVAFVTVGVSSADQHVGLGTASSFGVLAGAGVTNSGATIVDGDLGTCPNPAITGFPPGVVTGTTHAADAVCFQAQEDLTAAYDDAAGRAPSRTFDGATDLGGERLVAGVYETAVSFGITGTLTLDAEGDANAVFIFQADSTLTAEVDSTVALVNGAQACNVFWQVGSSATLKTNSVFVGTIMALMDISVGTDAVVDGRLLARSGAVTLLDNDITVPECATTTTTTAADTTTTSSTTTTLADTTTTTALDTTTTLADTTTTTAPDTTTTVPDTTTTTAPDTTTTTAPDTTTTLPDTTTTTPPTTASTAVPSSTTTVPAITSTTVPSATTTTLPSTTTVVETNVLSTSTTTASGEATTAADDNGAGTTNHSATAARSETNRTLPNTGAAVGWTAVAGVLTTALGTLVLLLNSRRQGSDRS